MITPSSACRCPHHTVCIRRLAIISGIFSFFFLIKKNIRLKVLLLTFLPRRPGASRQLMIVFAARCARALPPRWGDTASRTFLPLSLSSMQMIPAGSAPLLMTHIRSTTSTLSQRCVTRSLSPVIRSSGAAVSSHVQLPCSDRGKRVKSPLDNFERSPAAGWIYVWWESQNFCRKKSVSS